MRADAYKAFAAAIKDDFDFEPYWNNTLFKQGAELVALQRDNLDLCNLAPADISKQIPAWSLMTSAYLFRDYDHLKKTFASDVGQEFIKMARDQLGVEVIRPVYFGARQVNLKPNKRVNTPTDLAGIKLRMPPGEFWQFLGESIGANPTPVAFAELYTALQTGTVDGQDNPLVTARSMKFPLRRVNCSVRCRPTRPRATARSRPRKPGPAPASGMREIAGLRFLPSGVPLRRATAGHDKSWEDGKWRNWGSVRARLGSSH